MSDIYYEVMRDYTTTIHYSVGLNNSLFHFHHQVEILYIEKGKMTVILNDEKRLLTEKQLVIIDSFDNHQYIPENKKVVSHCLIIPAHYLRKYSANLSNKTLKNKFITNTADSVRIFNCMKNVVNAQNSNELILEGNIQILLGNIIENNIIVEKNKTNYDLVKNILLYIEENYRNTITLDTIAKHFGYSKYYFSHLFNKCFHCNLNDYLNLVRCRHSINFVIEDHMSVSEAAFASGFISMRTFYRTFKKYFKVTPKEYFQKNKKD